MQQFNKKGDNRQLHFNHNDRLYMHKHLEARSPPGHSPAEPHYNYRELKLETAPVKRTSPTYQSTVFNKKTYEYDQGARNLHSITNSRLTSLIDDKPVCKGTQPQTAYQRQFQAPGYSVWKGSSQAYPPANQLKIGHNY